MSLNLASPLKLVIPHLAPATLHPKVMASFMDRPIERPCIVPALNVSPAPKVSINLSGGNIGDVTVSCPIDLAAAPSSPHAQITIALKNDLYIKTIYTGAHAVLYA